MKLYVICDTPRCVSATISVCILKIPDLGLNMFAIGVKVQPKGGWLDSVYKLDAWVDKYLMNIKKILRVDEVKDFANCGLPIQPLAA